MSSLLLGLLNEELTEEEQRIIVRNVYEFAKGDLSTRKGPVDRSKTPGPAKTLHEFYDLVRQAINHYESRASVPEANKVNFTEEEPDIDSETESIVFSLVKREPGQFGQGPPLDAKHHNLKPMLREEADDPDNPGYKCAVTGYWYDNVVRFTCWARTNKAANARAMWFENLMEEYTWWFRLQGVSRVLFWGRDADIVTEVTGNKWYGRPIHFFVKTEKVRVFKQKTLEEIFIDIKTKIQ